MKITIVIQDVPNGVNIQFLSDRGALIHRRQSPKPTLAEMVAGKVQKFINDLEARQHEPPPPMPNGGEGPAIEIPVRVQSPTAEPEIKIAEDIPPPAVAMSACCKVIADPWPEDKFGTFKTYVCRKCGKDCEAL